MSKSLNKIQVIGNLGNDPDIRVTQSGAKVATLSVATTESWKTKDGNQQEHTEWHKVTFWGATADVCEKYLKKGQRVYVEGSIRTEKWQDKDGNDRYTTEIKGRDLIMLGGKGDGGSGPNSSGVGGLSSAPSGQPVLNDDDIPF